MAFPLLSQLTARALHSRIATTRSLALVFLLLLLVTNSFWAQNGFAEILFETAGLVLVGIGALGRLWASMYIAGYKTRTLVTEGPYSVVQNPLYVFSFIGALGIGLAAKSLLILALIVVVFVWYYPQVVFEEERKLAGKHSLEYSDYSSRTPRFVPRFSLFSEPDTYMVHARQYRKAFLDASFFIWFYGLLQLIAKLHELHVLPALFRIP